MKIAVLKERAAGETRVAATPDTVKKMIALGASVYVESGAGVLASIANSAYSEAGATVASLKGTLEKADLILKVNRPLTAQEDASDGWDLYPSGATLVGMLNPMQEQAFLPHYVAKKITAFALELIPRISRAQAMDVLSSQSNLAGYRAVIEAVNLYGRAMPMMMTAAGTVAPARVLILGAGVAGLQAIATAKRLGARVFAFDVRAAAKEQVESLGATFVSVESIESGEGSGGYAKEMSADYQKAQAQKIKDTLEKCDIAIATALIPGRKAPILVTEDMIDVMRPGSVVVDLAVEMGGNVEGSAINQIVDKKGVHIIGYPKMACRLASDASALYARNVWHFIQLFITKEGALSFPFDDEIIQGTALTHQGAIIHPNYQ